MPVRVMTEEEWKKLSPRGFGRSVFDQTDECAQALLKIEKMSPGEIVMIKLRADTIASINKPKPYEALAHKLKYYYHKKTKARPNGRRPELVIRWKYAGTKNEAIFVHFPRKRPKAA